jgi:hypothetical protein
LAIICSCGKTFSVARDQCLAPHFIEALKTSQAKFGSQENAFLHFQLSGIMYLFLYFMQAKNIPPALPLLEGQFPASQFG